MEEMTSLWNQQQQNIDELKLRIHYTRLELEAVKSKATEEMNKQNKLVEQLLHLLKLVCQERDEAKDQIHKLQMKIMPSLKNPLVSNCVVTDQLHHHPQKHHLTKPIKANSVVAKSNVFADAYNYSSWPIDSLFDPVTSQEFGNINTNTFDQDYQDVIWSNASGNVPNIDPNMLTMENMIKGKALPQKGNLLKAVTEAGPLLKTLLSTTGSPHNFVELTPPFPCYRNGGQNQMALKMKQSQPLFGGDNILNLDDMNYGNYNQRKMVLCSPRTSNLGVVEKRQRFR
ncbi:uncharacterized protein [Rutidosis leptorrhynchoides]|uniref:uncharacterized protein n=1 Tax=Rutidosis leptorrhynchoides TaxID=125765 RepID=UPI003A9A1651